MEKSPRFSVLLFCKKIGMHNDILLLWGFSIDAWITIATVVAVILVMLLTKVRTDAVMLIAISALFATGVLDAKEMCSGFSAGTVVVTGVLAVVMAGLRHTGVLQWMLKHIFGLPDNYPKALLRMMVPVAMLSAYHSSTAQSSPHWPCCSSAAAPSIKAWKPSTGAH